MKKAASTVKKIPKKRRAATDRAGPFFGDYDDLSAVPTRRQRQKRTGKTKAG